MQPMPDKTLVLSLVLHYLFRRVEPKCSKDMHVITNLIQLNKQFYKRRLCVLHCNTNVTHSFCFDNQPVLSPHSQALYNWHLQTNFPRCHVSVTSHTPTAYIIESPGMLVITHIAIFDMKEKKILIKS